MHNQTQIKKSVSHSGTPQTELNPQTATPAYAPMRVKHIPEHFQLVTDSQDIKAVLDYFGVKADYGCLFVEVLDGDYGTVFACERSIPYLDEPVFALDAYNQFKRVHTTKD